MVKAARDEMSAALSRPTETHLAPKQPLSSSLDQNRQPLPVRSRKARQVTIWNENGRVIIRSSKSKREANIEKTGETASSDLLQRPRSKSHTSNQRSSSNGSQRPGCKGDSGHKEVHRVSPDILSSRSSVVFDLLPSSDSEDEVPSEILSQGYCLQRGQYNKSEDKTEFEIPSGPSMPATSSSFTSLAVHDVQSRREPSEELPFHAPQAVVYKPIDAFKDYSFSPVPKVPQMPSRSRTLNPDVFIPQYVNICAM